MKHPKAIASIVLLVILAGCVQDAPFQQSVRVKVTKDGNPARGIAFRYHSEENCKGPYKAAQTSGDGAATINRTAIRGGIAVRLEKPSLCFFHNGNWYASWQDYIDPAEVENFTCQMQANNRVSCFNDAMRAGT